MNKDELKNRISMALKEPILQQGFECICKNLVELEKENAKLKSIADFQTSINMERHFQLKRNKEQLTKAKEIIKKFSEFVNIEVAYVLEYPQEITDKWNELCKQTKQFLNSEVEK